MWRSSGIVVVALFTLLAGSAGAQPPGGTGEDQRLRDIRQRIDAAAAVYGPRVLLEPEVVRWLGPGGISSLTGAAAMLSDDRLYLAADAVVSPHRDALIAAAVAYRLLDRRPAATTLAGYEQELRTWAREANAKAVEVLERAYGLPEEAAVRAVAGWVLAQHAAASDRHTEVMLCDELQDLATRFGARAGAVPTPCGGAGGLPAGPPRPTPGAGPALLVLVTPVPASRPVSGEPATTAGPAGTPSSASNVPPAYCTPGHRLRYVYQCPSP